MLFAMVNWRADFPIDEGLIDLAGRIRILGTKINAQHRTRKDIKRVR